MSREVVAKRVASEFATLPEPAKYSFVNDTLNVLMNLGRKQVQKLAGKAVKRGRPSVEDLETINQLVITFLYSIKEEFRPKWAFMVYKMLGHPPPEDLQDKIKMAEEIRYLHIGVSPETYKRVEESFNDLEVQTWDQFFEKVLEK